MHAAALSENMFVLCPKPRAGTVPTPYVKNGAVFLFNSLEELTAFVALVRPPGVGLWGAESWEQLLEILRLGETAGAKFVIIDPPPPATRNFTLSGGLLSQAIQYVRDVIGGIQPGESN